MTTRNTTRQFSTFQQSRHHQKGTTKCILPTDSPSIKSLKTKQKNLLIIQSTTAQRIPVPIATLQHSASKASFNCKSIIIQTQVTVHSSSSSSGGDALGSNGDPLVKSTGVGYKSSSWEPVSGSACEAGSEADWVESLVVGVEALGGTGTLSCNRLSLKS